MLRKLDEEYIEWGLSINRLYQKLNFILSHNYLGVICNKNNSSISETKKRTTLGKQTTKQLHSIIWNKDIKRDKPKLEFTKQ